MLRVEITPTGTHGYSDWVEARVVDDDIHTVQYVMVKFPLVTAPQPRNWEDLPKEEIDKLEAAVLEQYRKNQAEE
jgi:hypothetical protein